MRTIEVRRHAQTKKGSGRGEGSHLSQEGVTAARRIGASIGPFAYVLVSDVPRTLETAVALGFAVNACITMGGDELDAARDEIAHHSWWDDPEPFAVWKEHLMRGGRVAALARRQEQLWRHAIGAVPDGSAALVISHGGLIEPGVVACLPSRAASAWGDPFGHLEGARLTFADDEWCEIELLRVG